MGAPRRPIDEAREFGRLVERERKPREKLEAVFFRVHRRDPKRWGSPSKMWRLWREFQADKKRQQAAERRFALMDQQIRQFQEKSKRTAAEFEERIRQAEAEFVQRNPHMAGWREDCDRLLKKIETQMDDVLLKVPPHFRHLLRR
jgi:hypothetical protein